MDDALVEVEDGCEVIQLLLVAESYLGLARPWIDQYGQFTLSATKDRFSPGRPLQHEDLELLYLRADLDSAAIRLWALEEITKSDLHRTVEAYFRGGNPTADVNLRDADIIRRWLHGMMGDNAGHAMADNPDVVKAPERRKLARRQAVEELTNAQVYKVLLEIASGQRESLAVRIDLPRRIAML